MAAWCEAVAASAASSCEARTSLTSGIDGPDLGSERFASLVLADVASSVGGAGP